MFSVCVGYTDQYSSELLSTVAGKLLLYIDRVILWNSIHEGASATLLKQQGERPENIS